MGLSNYELVLLDNLIYLGSVPKYFHDNGANHTIAELIDYLVTDGYEESGISDGKCDMSEQEWLGILNAIAGDDTLKNLVIHEVKDKSDSFRAMTLVGKDENIIIFRGTSSDQEWIDDGQGALNEIFDMPEYHGMYINGSPEDKIFLLPQKRGAKSEITLSGLAFFNLMIYSVVFLYSGQIRRSIVKAETVVSSWQEKCVI